jgi:hypothetical protein
VRRAFVTAGLLCAAIGAGCATQGDDGERRAGERLAGDQRVAVTERGSRLPPGCRPAEVAGLLGELFDALNRADRQRARALVLDPEMLGLIERPAGGHPLRLRAVIVGYANGLGQIEFRAAGRLHGKGAVDCETRRLVAVGLGLEREHMAPLCGPSQHPARATLACARDWS